MISEFFLNIIFSIVSGMLNMLPDFTWSVESSAFEYLISFIRMVGYLLPWGTISAIIVLVISIHAIRFVIALVKVIWELLPLV